MHVAGGAPKLIAYLYSGQGAINFFRDRPTAKHFLYATQENKQLTN